MEMENGKYFQKEMIMLILVPRVLMQFADGEQTLEYISRYWNDEIKVCIHLYSSYCQLSTGLHGGNDISGSMFSRACSEDKLS